MPGFLIRHVELSRRLELLALVAVIATGFAGGWWALLSQPEAASHRVAVSVRSSSPAADEALLIVSVVNKAQSIGDLGIHLGGGANWASHHHISRLSRSCRQVTDEVVGCGAVPAGSQITVTIAGTPYCRCGGYVLALLDLSSGGWQQVSDAIPFTELSAA